MVKKNKLGDYIITCDCCGNSRPEPFYNWRTAVSFALEQGWNFDEEFGLVECPQCIKE